MNEYFIYIKSRDGKILQYKELLCIDRKEAERRGLRTTYTYNNHFGCTYFKYLKVRKVAIRKEKNGKL